MGFNTVAVLYNDRAHDLSKDGPIGAEMANAITHGWLKRKRDRLATWFGVGMVVSQDHADNSQVVIVGRNTGCRALEAENLDWWALKQMADCLERHGYRVTKPRKQKVSKDSSALARSAAES